MSCGGSGLGAFPFPKIGGMHDAQSITHPTAIKAINQIRFFIFRNPYSLSVVLAAKQELKGI